MYANNYMNNNIQFSFYLDTRRKKKDGTYPLKLQLYVSNPKTQKYYPTSFNYTEADYNKINKQDYSRIPKEIKEEKIKLNSIILKANEAANITQPFNLELFERRLLAKSGEAQSIAYHYISRIEDLKQQGRLSTASNYELSFKSIRNFASYKGKRNGELRFIHLTSSWLEEYEKYMLSIDRSISTVGIYLRPLKAIFNSAIRNKDISEDLYPFGRNKYIIPSSNNTKKALSREQLKTLYNSRPKTKEQEKAKDFWFLSFNCNGMNIKDIALLKHKDLEDEKFEFYRAKTKLTSKANLETITVFLNPYIKDIIKKHGTDANSSHYVFDILSSIDNAEVQRKKIQNFTRYINQHLKTLCIENGLPGTISTYWARHSFTTQSVRKGASLELMREFLGHRDTKTTQNYLDSFDDESKKEFAQNIMDF